MIACLASVSIDELTFVCDRGRRKSGHKHHRHAIRNPNDPWEYVLIEWRDDSPGASPDDPSLKVAQSIRMIGERL